MQTRKKRKLTTHSSKFGYTHHHTFGVTIHRAADVAAEIRLCRQATRGTLVVSAGLEGDGPDDDLVVHRRKRRSGERAHPEDPLSPSNASIAIAIVVVRR
jgi:hypothetical protein